MIKSRAKPQAQLLPDMTPLLDIIFILIVFLMLTAAVNLNVLEVNLPTSEADAVAQADKQSITLNILEQAPNWAINGDKFADWDEFSAQVLTLGKNSKTSILIGAEQTADIQYLVKLLTFLQSNGIQATQLLIEPEAQ